LLISSEASAANYSYIIEGYVRYSDGNPAAGAQVTVTMKYSGGGSHSHITTTTSGGYYLITFHKEDWNPGDYYDIVATKGSDYADDLNNLADSSGYAYIDLQFTNPIAEFGSIVGFFVAGTIVAGVVMVTLRRKA